MAAIDLRYARALERVVTARNESTSATKSQLEDFLTTFADSSELREVLEDPSIPQESKVRVLGTIADRAGISGTVRNFLAVVTAHERLHELRSIVDAYLQLSDRDRGIAEAEIISARPLDEDGRRALEAGIAQLTGGTEVRAVYREDPSLLGGAVVKVGSTVYDGSVRGQLDQMRQRLANA